MRPLQTPGRTRSVPGLVGLVSVYCDWESKFVLPVWQHVEMSEQMCPWERPCVLLGCWQPRKRPAVCRLSSCFFTPTNQPPAFFGAGGFSCLEVFLYPLPCLFSKLTCWTSENAFTIGLGVEVPRFVRDRYLMAGALIHGRRWAQTDNKLIDEQMKWPVNDL